MSCTESEAFIAYVDIDGDGFGDAQDARAVCALGPGLVNNAEDCDDGSPGTAPDKPEICDGADNNCDGQIDEGLDLTTWFVDEDDDGFGTRTGEPVQACAAPPGYAPEPGDCDDTDPNVFPGNVERCDGLDNDCNGRFDDQDPGLDPSGASTYFVDVDGDTFGDPTSAKAFCTQPPNRVTNDQDCNDSNPNVHPNATEVCNNEDDNCDALVDDDDPGVDPGTFRDWFRDADGDGLGNAAAVARQCARPADHVGNADDCDDGDDAVGGPKAWRIDADEDGYGAGVPALLCEAPAGSVLAQGVADCDDTNPSIRPDAIEICDGAIDNDCDGLADDADPSLDLATAILFHPDLDGDRFGNGDVDLYRCVQPPNAVLDDRDCDDARPMVNPDGWEVCDNLDNDCDGLRDDDDPGVDTSDFLPWFPDADQDGFGTIVGAIEACEPPEGFSDDGTDCNDEDGTITAPTLWYLDDDGDGHGAGLPVFGPSCAAPPALAPGWVAADCDDLDTAVSPSATEVCEDGVDNDCDGQDLRCPLPESCRAWLALDPLAPSGVYGIEPIAYQGIYDVYCDMRTDGGGWTLVGSSRGRPLSDAAIPYHAGLSTLAPSGEARGVWNGMRPVAPNGRADVRFSCKIDVADPDFTVDLSMYDVTWYHEFTLGSDAASCFSEGDGAGYDVVPARRDNQTGQSLPLGDDWNTGYLEGEDSCADSDFAIDFDDRGVAGDPNDGTDWGFADGLERCGTSGAGDAWFLFVREIAE